MSQRGLSHRNSVPSCDALGAHRDETSSSAWTWAFPRHRCLHDPRNEHDACGVGFIANVKGKKSNAIVQQGLQILVNLDHRGAVGRRPPAGRRRAGILIRDSGQAVLRMGAKEAKVELPQQGRLRRRHVLPAAGPGGARVRDEPVRQRSRRNRSRSCSAWPGDVPINKKGSRQGRDRGNARDQAGRHRQGLAVDEPGCVRAEAAGHPARRRRTRPAGRSAKKKNLPGLGEFYMPSLSTRTIVYKGLLLARASRRRYYADLTDPRTAKRARARPPALLDQHLPRAGDLAHPYRYDRPQRRDQHGARQRQLDACARGSSMASALLGADLDKVWPLIPHGQSDHGSSRQRARTAGRGRLPARRTR